MGNQRRELLALRTIVVSGRAALLKNPTADAREHITARLTELLAELEETVIRDGADAEVLARLDAARRDGWKQALLPRTGAPVTPSGTPIRRVGEGTDVLHEGRIGLLNRPDGLLQSDPR